MNDDKTPSHHGMAEHSETEYPNETVRLLLERASCRSFADRKIPPEVLGLVLEAGTRAATGGNLQPFSIIRIEDKAVKETLAELCGNQPFIATAPVDLLFCLDWHRLQRWAQLELAPFNATASFRHFWISFQDTIIAAQNICTAADALGLGSVYVGTVLECFRQLRDMFELPDGVFPVVLLSLGYPKAKPSRRRKLPVDVIVHKDKYREIPDRDLVKAFDEKYPELKIEITDQRLTTIEKVCREVHGEDFAKTCLDKIRENGYINAVQRYFGLHYRADQMPADNDAYLELMNEFGFRWFRKYHPPGHEPQ
ncbi:MAG TPA: nitroreductase family protein [Acidobacteriota bacterium]|nr:nitroreductase family protein [Acidobacteriota bacterium]